MRFLSLTLEECGRFSEAVSLGPFAPGLNLVAARNEAGKSTALAALRLLFEAKHTTRSREVERLRPYAGGSPFVSCTFALDDAEWRLSKRYLGNRSAELTRVNGGGLVRGGEVDDRLGELLGVSGHRQALLSQLWVEQGAALPSRGREARASTSDQANARRLTELVTASASETVVSSRLADIEARVLADLRVYLTDTLRQPRQHGPWQRAIAARDAAEERLAEAEAAADAARERLDRARDLAAMLAEIDHPDGLPASKAKHAELIEAVAEAERISAEVRRAHERIEHLKAQAALAQTERETLLARSKIIDRLRQLDQSLETAADVIADAEDAALAARERHDGVIAEHKALALASEARRLASAYKSAGIQRARLADQVSKARAHASDLDRLNREIADLTITDEALAGLRSADRAVIEARAAVDALATELVVTYEPGCEARIEMDRQSLSDGERVRLEKPAMLSVPGIGTISIAPGGDVFAADARDQLTTATHALSTALAECGVTSVADAEALLALRADLTAKRVSIVAALGVLAPAGVVELERACEIARDEETALERAVADQPTPVDDDRSQEEIEAAFEDARQRRQVTEAALREAEGRLTDYRARRQARANERSLLAEQLKARAAPVDETGHARDADDVARRLGQVSDELAEAREALGGWQRQAMDTDQLTGLRHRRDQVAREVAVTSDARARIVADRQRLDGAISADRDAGPAAEYDAALA
ncbi:MAG: AAA family ATPase, partial [Pseudomonadota bacterium]